jgi:hypothetical protein
VFNEAALDAVMRELDTIVDFGDYLERKAALVRSGNLTMAAGEEELLAIYLTNLDEAGDRAFVNPAGGSWREGDRLVVTPGHYEDLLQHPRYLAKKRADRISYVWDQLITTFTTHILRGTLEHSAGLGWADATSEQHELGVRYMALEPRVRRRMHGEAIVGALQRPLTSSQRFFRAMLPATSAKGDDTAFGILLLPCPDDLPGGYTQYRRTRAQMLWAYGANLLLRRRDLARFIGVALEPEVVGKHREGGSEDLVFFEPREWDEELA